MSDDRSNYVSTPVVDDLYLDILIDRSVFLDPSDEVYQIENRYNRRPDLLSYDRYGTSKYWWVFARRNMNVLVDPIGDFVTGTVIKIPNQKNIENIR